MSDGKDSGVNGWKVLALLLTTVLAAVVCVFFVLRDNTEESGNPSAATAFSSGEDAGSSEAVTAAEDNATDVASSDAADSASEEPESPVTVTREEEAFDIRVTFADGFHHTRIEGTTAYIMEGRDNPAGEAIRTLTSDKMGRIRTSLPAGDYTLVFGDEAYYDGMENITIGAPEGPGHDFISDSGSNSSGYVFWKYLLPRQVGNSICLVLEWRGRDDLDLCVFNAGQKRYISAVQPQDGEGCYLVEDDGEGSPGWEVVVIKDFTRSDVYTPFIRDGNSLMRGSLSAMEANGVRLSVLDQNGLLFSQEANPEERAALWMPCYIHKGKVIRESVYEYDPAKYAWAAYSKY